MKLLTVTLKHTSIAIWVCDQLKYLVTDSQIELTHSLCIHAYVTV